MCLSEHVLLIVGITCHEICRTKSDQQQRERSAKQDILQTRMRYAMQLCCKAVAKCNVCSTPPNMPQLTTDNGSAADTMWCWSASVTPYRCHTHACMHAYTRNPHAKSIEPPYSEQSQTPQGVPSPPQQLCAGHGVCLRRGKGVCTKMSCYPPLCWHGD